MREQVSSLGKYTHVQQFPIIQHASPPRYPPPDVVQKDTSTLIGALKETRHQAHQQPRK